MSSTPPASLERSCGQRRLRLQRDNDRLSRAYLLKETFADILDRRQPLVVNAKLKVLRPRVFLDT